MKKRDEAIEGEIVEKTQGTSTALARAARNELAIAATATAAAERVRAQFLLARQFPRDMDQARVMILKRCTNPAFAEVAWFKVERGKKLNKATGQWETNYIEGPSVRFAEEAVRLFGNIGVSAEILYSDDEKQNIRIEAIDFETGASWSTQVTVDRTVERRELRKGQIPISSRQNSYGEVVYVLPATEDEFTTKRNAALSKAKRTESLRLIPGDVVDEAKKRIFETRMKEIKSDPDAARKRIIDTFATFGVMPAQLVDYLGGRELVVLSPAEIETLGALAMAMKDCHVSWPEAFAASPYRDVQEMPTTETEQKKISETRAKILEVQEKRRASRKAPKEKPAKEKPADPGSEEPLEPGSMG